MIQVISTRRPQNVQAIQKIIGPAVFYVNAGEAEVYRQAGAKSVYECGTNIVQARNTAIEHAHAIGEPSVQVSDDLRGIKQVWLQGGKRKVKDVPFNFVVDTLCAELRKMNYFYGGVAVTTNRLNYTGIDFSYDKLVVCDLIVVMPGPHRFPNIPLKEDYALTIQQLLDVGGVVRCNQFLCDFPHRENAGGANTYRNTETEDAATRLLIQHYGQYLKPHATRPGQVSLNYFEIRKPRTQSLF